MLLNDVVELLVVQAGFFEGLPAPAMEQHKLGTATHLIHAHLPAAHRR
jgi:hypothetical protein